MAGGSLVTTPYEHFDNPYQKAVLIDVSNLTASANPLDLVALLGGGRPVTGIMTSGTSANGETVTLYFKDDSTTGVEVKLGRGVLYPFNITHLDIQLLPTNDLVVFG